MDFSTIVILTGVFFYVLTCLAIFDIVRKDFGGIHFKALWGFIALILTLLSTEWWFRRRWGHL